MKKYRLFAYLSLLMLLYGSIRFILLVRPEISFPLSLEWQVDLGFSTYERPAYQDGLVLVPASNLFSSHWYGVEAATGEMIWSQTVRRNSFRRCLTSKYLVVSGPSSFVTLETSTGQVIWTRERAHIATCNEQIVFSSGVPRDTVHAFDLSTGQQLWGATEPMQTFSTIIYNPETEELIAGGEAIIDPTSGRIVRPFGHLPVIPPVENIRGPMLIIDQGQLFLGGTVQDAQTGEIVHKADTYDTSTLPTVTMDTMYLTSGSTVVAFDRATYNIKWIYPAQPNFGGWIPIYTLSPVAILDGIGYVIYSDATLRAFDLETGQELGYWQPSLLDRLFWPVCVPLPFPLCTGTTGVGMATSEDTLFVSFGDGKLYAFGKE